MQRLKVLLLCIAFALAGPGVFFMGAPAAIAQEAASNEVDYEAWDGVATRAEEAVQARRASETAFEALRNELTQWRARFVAAQSENSARIATLEAQINALGASGEAELPPELAKRRAQLADELAEARAPVLRADEAYRRADGLIQQVDSIIRERQADKLLELMPTPLNPAHWREGLLALGTSVGELRNELVSFWMTPAKRAEFKSGLPLVLVLLVIAALLLIRGQHWIWVLRSRFGEHGRTSIRLLTRTVVSLSEIVIPFIGLLALTEAVASTGLSAPNATEVLEAIPRAGLAFLIARWLGVRMFHGHLNEKMDLHLSDEDRAQGRWLSAAIGCVIAANILLRSVVDPDQFATSVRPALFFPLLVVAGLLLFRLGQLLGRHFTNVVASGKDVTFRDRTIRLIARAVITLPLLGITLAAIGYFNLGVRMIYPLATTLALISFLTVLQRIVAQIYAFLTSDEEGEGDALIPVLIGFVMAIASAPVFALIWGARVATLSEYWTQFRTGISIGDIRISPEVFLTLALLFAAGFALTRLLQGVLRNTVLPKTRIDIGGQNAIVAGVGYVGIFLAALVAITGAGIDLSSLAIVAGALSVGIGFGLQNIVSNFVSGIILLIERPISEGDWIDVAGKSGYVRDISVRSTRIETFDKANVIIPNADLISGVVVNMTKGSLLGRVIVPVSVALGNDTKRVEAILQEIAEAHPMVVMNPEPTVLFHGFGQGCLNFEIRAFLRDINWIMNVMSDMNHEIVRRFAEEGVEIPFPQRDIWLRNPETLREGAHGGASVHPAASVRRAPHQPSRMQDAAKGDGGDT